MIELQNICLSFDGRELLRDFSLTLPEQGAVCLFAPSGSGKTTLLRILCGLQAVDSGTITGIRGKRIAMLFQENRLISHLSIEDNLRLVLPKERRDEARLWLSRIGLLQDAEKTPLQCSGGMNRRLAIARTLAFGGDIFLMDEPFQGLDEASYQQVMQLIREETKNHLLLLVTHRREEAEDLCQTLLTLEGSPLHLQSEQALPLKKENPPS